jgi:signal transduction histidine kinase
MIGAKLWSLGGSTYQILTLGIVIYFTTLLGQARNSARATRAAIEVRFELADSHAKLRAIEHKQTLEQERQRLMQDMHDGLGSSLISALRVVEHSKMDANELAEVLKGCIDDLKLAIDSMEPVDDNLLLLLATLRFRLGPQLDNTGIKLIWQVEKIPALLWLDPKNALHILRILQEAFANIIKHTSATEVRLATMTEGDAVMVTVSDNGPGFDLDHALKSGGMGLSGQKSRAVALGGEVSWHSSSNGTCLSLRLPISRPV